MVQPNSTIDNSTAWRLFHGIWYLIGALNILVGSFVLIPSLGDYFDIASVSAWLYTIGSLAFIVADTT
jgi:hypothetical protein